MVAVAKRRVRAKGRYIPTGRGMRGKLISGSFLVQNFQILH